MFNYLKKSFARKIARRVTKEYPTRVDSFQVEGIGKVDFTNWENPLVSSHVISEDTMAFFRKFIGTGDMAIDIGANVGIMTTQISLITGKGGLVLGFDPNPYVFKILSMNQKLNQDKTNIAVYNVAISDQDDEFYYNAGEASFSNGGISREKENRHGKYSISTKVKGVNLTGFLNDKHQEHLDKLKLIKIDTEGYDKEIIKSISDLLAKYKPVVISECFKNNSDEARFEQFELLHNIGYSIYYFSDFNVNAEIVPILKKEDMLKWKHFDVYAIAE